jgi:hypothetical protein
MNCQSIDIDGQPGHRLQNQDTSSRTVSTIKMGLDVHQASVGVESYVTTAQILDTSFRGVKTDGRDARELCLRLDRYVQGNHQSLTMVHVPTPEQEQQRNVSRQRQQLLRRRVAPEITGRSLPSAPGRFEAGSWRRPLRWNQLEGHLPGWLQTRLRQALIEMAWRTARFQPNYHAVKKWKDEMVEAALTHRPRRKKMIVAIARQLAVDLWRLNTGQTTTTRKTWHDPRYHLNPLERLAAARSRCCAGVPTRVSKMERRRCSSSRNDRIGHIVLGLVPTHGWETGRDVNLAPTERGPVTQLSANFIRDAHDLISLNQPLTSFMRATGYSTQEIKIRQLLLKNPLA